MALVKYIDFLKRVITRHKAELRFRIALASGVIIIGLVTSLFVHLFGGVELSDKTKWLMTLGGTFISSIASFPLNDIYGRKRKIDGLIFFMQEFEIAQVNEIAEDSEDVRRLKERFHKYIDSTIGG